MRHIKQYKIFESPKFTEEDISTMVDDMLYLINDILDDEFIKEWDDVGYPPSGNYTTTDSDFWKRDVTSYKDSLISDGIRIYTKSISKSKRIIERIKSEQDQIESYIGTSISINSSESNIKGDNNEKFIIISVGIKWKNFSDRVNDVKKFLSFVADLPKRMNESKLDDSVHNKKAINNINGHIGLINNWGWKGSYVFVDVEDGTTTEMKDLNDVRIIGDDEFYSLYDDRNYHVPKKGEVFTDRQKRYGKIHDFTLNATQKYSNGEYSDDFCREVAQIISTTAFYKAILKEYGTVDVEKIKEKDPSGLKEIFYSYQMCEDSCYSNMCDKMGLHGDSVMSESEIIGYLEDAREFSEEHGIKWIPEEMSQELEFFIKLI